MKFIEKLIKFMLKIFYKLIIYKIFKNKKASA